MQTMLHKASSGDQHTGSLLISSFELLKKNWIILHKILILGHDYNWQYKPEHSVFFAPVGMNMLHIILNVFGHIKTTLHDRT